MEEIKNETQSTNKQDFYKRAVEIIVLIGGLSGFFVALLWVFGRAYARGYFEAMNIPTYYVSFSTWEYAEVGWPSLIYPVSILLFSFCCINKIITSMIKNMKGAAYKFRLIYNFVISFLGRAGIILLVFIISSFAAFELLKYASSIGNRVGYQNVMNGGVQIDLLSKTPLNLDTPSSDLEEISEELSQYYVYTKYRLLNYNSGKYFLFKDIDTTTCKPKKVFVVYEEQLVQVNIYSVEPIVSECSIEGNTPVISPTQSIPSTAEP
ncbi:MAG: hypothetical protein PVF83_13315 [Anaerolineales bacterium]|jgi:hypothetical protein